METTAKAIQNHIEKRLKTIYDASECTAIGKTILEEILDIPRHQLPLNPDLDLSTQQEKTLDEAMSRLLNREPIQYIVGSCHFYGSEFKVNHNVLIPRPETEELVDMIINNHQSHSNLNVADIGAGSGCIAVSLAANLPSLEVTAIDVSEPALEITAANAAANEVRVICRKLDILYESLPPSHYDIIVSNPPYITNSERELMHENVLKHEPDLALFVPNESPLKFYKAIAQQGKQALRSKGWLYCEINEHFGSETAELFKSQGYQKVTMHQDMQGKDRMISCQKTP